MARLSPPHSKPVPNPISLFAQTVTNHNGHNFPSTSCFFPWRIGPLTHKKNPLHIFPSPSKSLFTLNCTSKRIGDDILSTSSAYEVLGVVPNCSPAELKAAFRTKVKQYHPDVRKDGELSDTMIRCVIQAYQVIWDPYQSCKDVHPCHPVTFYHGCLKCLEVVESYHPDRVLRQFGRVQTIPNPPLGPMRVSRGATTPMLCMHTWTSFGRHGTTMCYLIGGGVHRVCHRYIRLLILSLRLAMRTMFNILIGFTTQLMQSNNFFKISTLVKLRPAHPLRVSLHPALPMHIVLEHITLVGHIVNSSS